MIEELSEKKLWEERDRILKLKRQCETSLGEIDAEFVLRARLKNIIDRAELLTGMKVDSGFARGLMKEHKNCGNGTIAQMVKRAMVPEK